MQAQLQDWTGAHIGQPGKAGEHSVAGGVLTVTGSGAGLNASGEDQLHFVSIPAEGDLQIVARLTMLEGPARSEAGLMLRADHQPGGAVASVVFSRERSGEDPPRNVVELRGRQPGSHYAPVVYGTSTPLAPPLWLKLVRIGQDYSVYRSTDGHTWSPVHNDNGGPFLATGPIQAGVFVAGGPAGETATARFDQITVGLPQLEHKTSWIGNHFSTDSLGFVSNNVQALWVAPDGTCYTNTFFDEAGEAAKIYRDGKVIKPVDHPYGHNNHAYGGTVTGDANHLYLYTRERGIVSMDLMGTADSAKPFEFVVPLVHNQEERIASVFGTGVGNGELYVSDHKAGQDGQVLVASLESHKQLPQRSFKFNRPGPIAVDRRGNLWIIERAELVQEYGVALQKAGLIKCYTKDGTFTGRQITDLQNPTALAIDPNQDRLLVCENGPDQNVRIYSKLDSKPALMGSFGVKGGIWAGKHPGRLFDPTAGGSARLYHPNGVGVDRGGNIYVNCSGVGTDLRKYTPQGQMVWQLNGLHFVDTMDFDPDSDGRDLYGPVQHYTMDYARTAPGSEWNFISHTWNPFKYGPVPRPSVSPKVQRLGDKRALVMYTSGQGAAVAVNIFRYEGEIAVPCGRIEQTTTGPTSFVVWYDANGDGKKSPNEVSSVFSPGHGGFSSFDVDSKGDLWAVLHGTDDSYLRRWIFKGIDAHGSPIYGTAAGDYEDIPYPAPIGNSVGAVGRVHMDREHDALYLYGPNADKEQAKSIGNNELVYADKEQDKTYPWLLARYDNWSKGNRTASYVIQMPTPANDPNFLVQLPVPNWLNFTYQAFDVAGDYIFAGEILGPVHVFEAATGKPVTRLSAGPPVSGSAWQDAHAGLHAFARSDGEYIIIVQNSGWRAKNNMFRWRPQK